MINYKTILGTSIATVGMLLASTGMTSYAYGSHHSTGGHVSTHITTHTTTHPFTGGSHTSISRTRTTTHPSSGGSHTSISRTPTTSTTKAGISRSTTTRSSISNTQRGTLASKSRTATSMAKSGNSTKMPSNRSISSSVASQMPKTKATDKAIAETKSSSTYRSISSITRKTDFMMWTVYASNYYTRPYYYYYPWMPYWLWHSNRNTSQKVKQEVKQKSMKWIRIGNKTIAVPKNLYDKIKVGDMVELTDDTHIKINGKTYER